MCRVLGKCDYGEEIDLEMKALVPEAQGLGPLEDRRFRYVRYEHRFLPEEVEMMKATRKTNALGVDNVQLIPVLKDVGRAFAEANVQAAHLGFAAD